MSASAYQHSEVFAQLKNVKEVIQGNLTTHQYLATLDYFLDNAVAPILTAYPGLVDNYMAKIVAWQSHRPQVKFSREDKAHLSVHLFNALTTSGKVKREHFRVMMFNRGILFGLLSVFQRQVAEYKKLHDPLLKIKNRRRRLLLRKAELRTGSAYLYAAISESEYWASKAYRFKELIIQKYTRTTLMNAKSAYEEVGYAVPLNDVIQIYLTFLVKAIDRCHSQKGVLTTFVQNWFYSAKAAVMKAAVEERTVNGGDELLETVEHAIGPSTEYEAVQYLCATAKRLDPEGTLRFGLGIPEHFSSSDLRKIAMFITPEK